MSASPGDGMRGEGMSFSSVAEVEHALIFGAVHQHAKVKVRIKQIDDQGDVVFKRFETTPGRALLGSVLPLNAKTPFDIVNRLLRKKEVQEGYRYGLPVLRTKRVGNFLRPNYGRRV